MTIAEQLRADGRATGIADGRATGIADGERTLLERLIVRKFGTLDAEIRRRSAAASVFAEG